MKLKFSFSLLCSFVFTVNILAREDTLKKKSPFTFEISYVGDAVRNFSGGIKKGSRFLGLANMKTGFDTKTAHLWKGGQLFINVADAHGGNPTTDLIGDFHTASNIEADDITYIHELWYKQTIHQIEIIAGLQDLNTDFVSTEYGDVFINSTFATPSTIADNVPSPIFPLTAMGISLKWNVSKKSTWKIALFDGLPTSFSDNPHNLTWNFNKEEGVFAVSEYHITSLTNNRIKGSFRAGIYYHSQLIETDADYNKTILHTNNYGLYCIADQMIYQKPDSTGGFGIFVQVAISPKAINTHDSYIGFGLSYQGLFKKRKEDKLGLAYTYAGFNESSKKDEAIFEFCYKAQLFENIFFQPDLQYVVNPAGTNQNLNNALVGFIRLGLNF